MSDTRAQPVACLACERPVEWSDHGYHPHGAVIFTSSGNYGSTTFDSMHAQAAIAICDDCMKRKGWAVVVRKRVPNPAPIYVRVGDLHEYLAGAE